MPRWKQAKVFIGDAHFFLKKKGEWGDLNTELRARLIQTCNCSSNIFASPIIIFLIPYSYSDALFQIRGKNSTSRLWGFSFQSPHLLPNNLYKHTHCP